MYQVYADGELLYAPSLADPDHKYIILNPKITEEKNKAGSFEFSIPYANPRYDSIQKLKTVIIVKNGDEEIWKGRPLDEEISFNLNKKIYCEGELSFLNDIQFRPYNYSSGVLLSYYFQLLLNSYSEKVDEQHKIRPGILHGVESDFMIYPTNADYNGILSELTSQIINLYGGVFQLRKEGGITYLDYYKSGTNVDTTLEFQTHILDLSNYVDASSVYTSIIPLGKRLEGDNAGRLGIASVNTGVDYIVSKTGVNLYGVIEQVVIWDEVEDATELKNLATEELNKAIEEVTSITVSAVDLEVLSGERSDIKTGDQVRVVSKPHGIDSYFTCEKKSVDLADLSNTSYTFGADSVTLTGEQSNLSSAVTRAESSISSISGGSGGGGSGEYATKKELADLETEIENSFSSVNTKLNKTYKYQGDVSTFDDLNSISNREIGDTYNVLDTNANYAWTGSKWDKLSEDSALYVSMDAFLALEDRVSKLEGGA